MIAVDTSMSNYHKNLFRIPTISEKIALFRSLLDSYEIKPAEALALSGSIHAELRRVKGQDGSAYASYAQTMALLNYYLPDVHQHVVANWQLPQTRPIVSASAATKTYTDSLFDDTIAMRVPGNRPIYEANEGQAKDEAEMLEATNEEKVSDEAETGGEEDEESEGSEDEEPLEPEGQDITEDIKVEGDEFEFDEIKESEVGIEELETDELVYEDISEGESYNESEMEDTEVADYMDKTEYEIEPTEEEDPPWADD